MNLAYLTDIIILLTAAVIAVPLFRLLGLGTVPGFLTAGIVVGPSVLGLIANREEIGHLAELGVVLPDGGVPVAGFVRELAPENWDEVAREFLLSE